MNLLLVVEHVGGSIIVSVYAWCDLHQAKVLERLVLETDAYRALQYM